ncbi:MAG: cobalt-precorrin-5B (C(1))-methyltransferase CbiD [Cyanobacteria bacterium P01_H01_bin.15]
MRNKNQHSPGKGFTLPVFATAAAVGALRCLQGNKSKTVELQLINPAEIAEIPLEQVACLGSGVSLGIARSEPGENLDLTRQMPIWAKVALRSQTSEQPQILLVGGEGVGHDVKTGESAIYGYAKALMEVNLGPLLKPNQAITVTLILPTGKQLAKRTSNAAFGIVEGLALLGTHAIAEPLSAPAQLAEFQAALKTKSATYQTIVFCLGENGLDLARQAGVATDALVKTANWLGPMLVAAADTPISEILLFGYHGKLIKLAGGIFHTHHHLADGRQEILTAQAAHLGMPLPLLQKLFACPTIDAAWQFLQIEDQHNQTHWCPELFQQIAETIDRRTVEYLAKHTEQSLTIGSVLFSRDRKLIAKSQTGEKLWQKLIT